MVTRLGSHAVEVMAALFGATDAIDRAHVLREAGASGVFTFEGPHDVRLPAGPNRCGGTRGDR